MHSKRQKLFHVRVLLQLRFTGLPQRYNPQRQKNVNSMCNVYSFKGLKLKKLKMRLTKHLRRRLKNVDKLL